MKPELELVLTAEAKLASPIAMGTTWEGQSRVIPIIEGTIKGPGIEGEILQAGAADWQFTRTDGVTQAEATYAIQTNDGVVIQVNNFGLRHGPKKILERIMKGDAVDSTEYYFRTNPRFIAPSGKYDWLNRYIFVGTGARYADSIKLWFYRVL